jgi:hypothetical protein
MPAKNKKPGSTFPKGLIISEKLAMKLLALTTDYYKLLDIEIASSLNNAELKKEYKKKRKEADQLGYQLDRAIEQ